MRLPLLAAALLMLTGFSFAPPHRDLARPTPVFDAENFFLGRTIGNGFVKQALSGRSSLSVESVGRVVDGTLVLDQRVQRQGEPVERRQWKIRKLGPGRFTGTISDAKGPVSLDVSGNCLRIRYVMKNNMRAEQYVYVQPDGKSALNRMTVKRFGMGFATVEETIRKVG